MPTISPAPEPSLETVLEEVRVLARDAAARHAMLEMALQELRLDVRRLQEETRGLQGEVRNSGGRDADFARLQERLADLERRLS